MAPPLLLLKDIHLTFGGTPLLEGAELSIGRGRAALPGRPQRLGQVDPAEDRRGHGRAGCAARASCSPAHHPLSAAGARTCPASPPTLGLRRGRARPGRRSAPRALSAGEPRPHRRAKTRRSSPAARRGARRSPACWRRSPTSCCSTSRPTISTCRRSNGLEAALKASRSRHGADQPRPALPANAVARHGLARPRHHAAARQGLRRLRGLARRRSSRTRSASATSSTADRAGGALAPLRRQRAAQAQPAPPRAAGWRCASERRHALPAASQATSKLTVQEARDAGKLVIEAERIAKSYGDRTDRARLLDPDRRAATASASSVRTAPARRR